MRKEITLKKFWPHSFPDRKGYLQKSLLILFVLFALSFQGLFAQGKSVSGVVKDENGINLPGVTVSIQGAPGVLQRTRMVNIRS